MFITVRLFLVAIALGMAGAALAETARGVVYHDKNGNSVRDKGEPGVRGVLVSNGEEVAVTDKQGRYELPVTDDTGIFVIKPSGWMTPLAPGTNIPRHYYLHKPQGSPPLKFPGVAPTGALPQSIDFPLLKQQEAKKFDVLVFGDTQPRDQREVDYLAHDIIEEVAGFKGAFGTTLGDLVFDDLSVFDSYVASIGLIGLPWHHVIGNHDVNYDAPRPDLADETYERYFGPSWYAFMYGDVVFFALNNIYWDPAAQKYHGEFGQKQRNFIANVLKHVRRDQLVVSMMHIPMNDVADAHAFFHLFDKHPHNISLSAHWHRQDHFFFGKEHGHDHDHPHHHVVNVTTCGSWWSGAPDEVGIPHTTMADGAPNGYNIFHFDGNRYRLEFKAARRPEEYQMNIHAPEALAASEAWKTAVYVNVFGGSEKTKVEMRLGEDGPWTTLNRTAEKDPYYQQLWDRQLALVRKIAADSGKNTEDMEVLRQIANEYRMELGRPLPEPRETGHLWKGMLPPNPAPGYRMLHVRTSDPFSPASAGRRVIRIE
jgi:hypothetical protein